MVIGLEQEVRIPAGSVPLEGTLVLPEDTGSLVIFAHGSGSSRRSPRNRFVAEVLQEEGIGTLLFDLLTREEDQMHVSRFDIALLRGRLAAATIWAEAQPECRGLAKGYFGASTGAAAALWAAAELGPRIGAVVSRGGRPDLAMPVLDRVQAPVLLIVGQRDHGVVDLNRRAYDRIRAARELKVIAGATHLFEEAGAMEQVAAEAASWFLRFLEGTDRKTAA